LWRKRYQDRLTETHKIQAIKKPDLSRAFLLSKARLFGSANVRSLLTLRTGDGIEGNALTFLQALEALGLDRGKVSEEIVTTTIRGDETETLGVVEPLDGTICHVLNFLKNKNKTRVRLSGETQDGDAGDIAEEPRTNQTTKT
jgi:hypothetical protein